MVVIISVGLIPIMNWAPLAIQTNIKVEQKTTVIFVAQEKIEDAKQRVLANLFSWTATGCNSESWTLGGVEGLTDICYDSSSLKNITVNAWHNESPAEVIAFNTKVARR